MYDGSPVLTDAASWMPPYESASVYGFSLVYSLPGGKGYASLHSLHCTDLTCSGRYLREDRVFWYLVTRVTPVRIAQVGSSMMVGLTYLLVYLFM